MKKLCTFLWIIFSLLNCASAIKGSELAREYYNLGNAHYELGDYGKAVFFLRKAVELDEDLQTARFNFSLALLKDGKADQAEDILKSLLEEDPENQSVVELLAYAYHTQGKEEEAIRIYRQILSNSPENANARYNLGILFWKMEQRENALSEFRRLIEFLPNDLDTLFNLGKLLLELNNPSEAVIFLKQYIQEQPADVEAYLLLAKGYRDRELYDKALDAYSSALVHDEKQAEAWFYSAQILLTKIEDPDRGLTALNQALDYGFKDLEMITALLESPDLLEEDKVKSLIEQRGLLP